MMVSVLFVRLMFAFTSTERPACSVKSCAMESAAFTVMSLFA